MLEKSLLRQDWLQYLFPEELYDVPTAHKIKYSTFSLHRSFLLPDFASHSDFSLPLSSPGTMWWWCCFWVTPSDAPGITPGNLGVPFWRLNPGLPLAKTLLSPWPHQTLFCWFHSPLPHLPGMPFSFSFMIHIRLLLLQEAFPDTTLLI